MTEHAQDPHVPEYRGYFFNNWYLRSIQQGIQAGHVVSTQALAIHREHFGEDNDLISEQYYFWAASPTKILLNGYGSTMMNKYRSIIQILGQGLKLPYAWFREPELEDCMTSIGIVVPDSIFDKWPTPKDAKLAVFQKDDVSLEDIFNRAQQTSMGDREALEDLLYLTLKSAPLAT